MQFQGLLGQGLAYKQNLANRGMVLKEQEAGDAAKMRALQMQGLQRQQDWAVQDRNRNTPQERQGPAMSSMDNGDMEPIYVALGANGQYSNVPAGTPGAIFHGMFPKGLRGSQMPGNAMMGGGGGGGGGKEDPSKAPPSAQAQRDALAQGQPSAWMSAFGHEYIPPSTTPPAGSPSPGTGTPNGAANNSGGRA